MMTESEQFEIIGRAVHEEKLLRSELIIHDIVLRRIVFALDQLKSDINKRTTPRAPFSAEIECLTIPSDLSKYSDFTTLAAVVNDRIAIQQKLRDAQTVLFSLGLMASS